MLLSFNRLRRISEFVCLSKAVERHLPFIAAVLHYLANPLLLLWAERPVAALVFVVHLGAMQIVSDAFAHRRVVPFQHLVVEVTESDSGMDRDNAAQEPKLEEKDMKFADGIRRLRDRVAEVDAEHPPLRDNGEKRITCVELWTTCPAPIEKAGREDEFFHRVHEEFCNFFGEENVGVSCIHKDEKHRELAEKVLIWTLRHMQDEKGFFYYQLKKGISSKISYMRWSNAFMFYAMSFFFMTNINNNNLETNK